MASQKYTVEQVVEMMNSDEPIFILRAQDELALSTINNYTNHLLHLFQNSKQLENMSDETFSKLIEGLVLTQRQFAEWKVINLHRIKYPTP